jgi:hypothetical protein
LVLATPVLLCREMTSSYLFLMSQTSIKRVICKID